MKISDCLQRAEILFWKVSVGLMRNQRAARITILICAVMIIAGILTILLVPNHEANQFSISVNPLNPEAPSEPPNTVNDDIGESKTSQSNLLVILVESLSAERPELLGIWLVEQADIVPQVVFLPVFPNGFKDESELYNQIFKLNQDGRPSPGFLDYLRTKNIWWDHFLILDKNTLSDLVALSGGVNWEGRISSGPEVIASITELGSAPETMLRAQAKVARVLCSSAPELIQNSDPEILWGLLTHRMRSDLELESIKTARLEFLQPGRSPICEFPTLQEMSYWTNTE